MKWIDQMLPYNEDAFSKYIWNGSVIVLLTSWHSLLVLGKMRIKLWLITYPSPSCSRWPSHIVISLILEGARLLITIPASPSGLVLVTGLLPNLTYIMYLRYSYAITLGLPRCLSSKEFVMRETQETQFLSLGQEDLLEEGMATHSSILVWRIPWT